MELLNRDPHAIVETGERTPTYDYTLIKPTPGVDLTLVYTLHNEVGGLPDYLKELLEGADVFIPELPGWTPQFERLLAKVAKGSYEALQKVISMGNGNKYNDVVMEAIYGSRVRIPMVDYKDGTFNFRETAAAMSKSPSDRNYPIFKRREQHILEGLSRVVADTVAEQGSDKPLKVVGTFGYLHMGMSDGLIHRNLLEGVSANIESRFEDSLANVSDTNAIQHAKDYQEWLRDDPQR